MSRDSSSQIKPLKILPPSAASGIQSSNTLRVRTGHPDEKTDPRIAPSGFSKPVTLLLIVARGDFSQAPQYVFKLADTLKDSGIRVLIASPPEPPFGTEFRRYAEIYIPIPRLKFHWSVLFELRRLVRKHRVNVIHSHGRISGLYSRLLGLLTPATALHSFHGTQYRRGWKGKRDLFIDQLLSGLPFWPIFLSPFELKTTQRIGIAQRPTASQKKLSALSEVVLDPGVEPKMYKPRVGASSPFNKSPIRIGCYLKPESIRGPDRLIKLAKLSNDLGKWSATGSTPEEISRFGRPPDSLEFVPASFENSKWLESLDVFVSASREENNLTPVLEAMAAGCVCVLSAIESHHFFQAQHAAILFNPEDPESFRQIIINLMNDKGLRDSLSSNARYMIERYYTLGHFTDRLIDIYREAARSSRV